MSEGDNYEFGPAAEILTTLGRHLLDGALPGEAEGLSGADLDDAVSFLAETAAVRPHGHHNIRLASLEATEIGARRMRLAVVNDDMPFIVDSLTSVLAAHGIDVHRLLHPIVSVRRDEAGKLVAILPVEASGERRESIVYMELERADARIRKTLEAEVDAVLANVRAAVNDWQRMQVSLRDDADLLPDGEGASLLRWFLDQRFTLLGHWVESRDGALTRPVGIFGVDATPVWSEASRKAAFEWFERGQPAPLLVKADREAVVHRRAPLDLIVLPVRDGSKITGLSVHAGLWTSAALRAPSDTVPVLRNRLAEIERKFAFSPSSHAGKALRHSLSALPHDLLVSFDLEQLETVALASMSLADRPRPKLLLIPGALCDHLFGFVWLPREEVSTARRKTIGDMIGNAARAPLVGWTMDLDSGELALLRYVYSLAGDAKVPDTEDLDRKLVEMLRGWAPAVEVALNATHPASRATRLALRYAPLFPTGYRDRYGPVEAAADINGIDALADANARGVRLYRAPHDEGSKLRLKIYRKGGLIALSDVVPVLEHFGFAVLKEVPTRLYSDIDGQIYEFLVSVESDAAAEALLKQSGIVEAAVAAVLCGTAENDSFNKLFISVGLDAKSVVLFRAWFRYLRQTGMTYGLDTVVAALARTPDIARSIITLFHARHNSDRLSEQESATANDAIDQALAAVAAIDDDHILRRLRSVVLATLRTNAFVVEQDEAMAFKLDSALVPGLPAPVPWREIWVYSPRVEGIHLRGGPIARGGLRWSDRRDDFRTEILGLMKAQVVKNAVIVPTGAKGGFYPKQLPPPGNRDAWLAEGTETYRVFIRALLSITDNLVEGAVVHPEKLVILDGDDPYFVVAADKGTATFSDVANAIAIERGFWLGDAFASGGSQGYDHKAMGITARGAWVSVQRHFAEMGTDVQTQSIRVVGCGDMSGDVFGNGMLLSKALKLVAAFDHRHIFLDPDPDPAASWEERNRMFALPRSSWADYKAELISKGGGIYPRTQKEIPLSAEIRAVLGIEKDVLDPSQLISAILRAPADLLWFGGIGTYVKARTESNLDVGDPANDAHRVNGDEVRAKAIGEGANLGVTQAGRIAFAAKGGRINTDFIDNSAGVDCSDNEVNIKIPLNREMIEGRLGFDQRNDFLRSMTDDVAKLVLEDNRLQTLSLSLAEHGGASALPAHVRVIEILEGAGRISRAVDGLDSNENLLRRVQEHRGLTRPELAILLSHSKLALQTAIEASTLADDPLLVPTLHAAFPSAMQRDFLPAIDQHRLRGNIIATKLSNRVINRLGFVAPFELAEEEGTSLAQVASGYVAVDALFDLGGLWDLIESAALDEASRFALFEFTASRVRLHVGAMLRVMESGFVPSATVTRLRPGITALNEVLPGLLFDEGLREAEALRLRLAGVEGVAELLEKVVRLAELDGVIGLAALAQAHGLDETGVAHAYALLGEELGLDWAKALATRHVTIDPWERLLAAGLARDFETLRLDFLARHAGHDPVEAVIHWLKEQAQRVDQFRTLVSRARSSAVPSAAMLAQIGSQARLLLAR